MEFGVERSTKRVIRGALAREEQTLLPQTVVAFPAFFVRFRRGLARTALAESLVVATVGALLPASVFFVYLQVFLLDRFLPQRSLTTQSLAVALVAFAIGVRLFMPAIRE